MIDPATARSFEAALIHARRRGLSLMEELDRRGLLVTSQVEIDQTARHLRMMVDRLEGRGPSALMAQRYGRPHGTPKEMFDAVVHFLNQYVDAWQL